MVAGRRIWRFATGQDIVERVAVESGDAPTTQSVPSFLSVGQAQAAEESVLFERLAEPHTEIPQRTRRQVIKYEVQEGDTIFGLADKFSIDPNTIFWANTETLQDNVHLIEVGLPLYVLPTDGVYHTATGGESIAEIAAEFGVTPQVVLESGYNNLPSDDETYQPAKGQRLVIAGGTREYISWTAPVIRTGTEDATSPEAVELHPGACRNFYTGVGGSGDFINPLGSVSYRVTTGFYGWHPGVDLAANLGTPVYAADSGVVIFAGRHTGGYGNLVVLDHGNSFTTYYAHLHARYVECGQSVNRGEALGQVGLTGATSGVHLHFEVRRDGKPHTPYLYIEIHDMRSGA